MIFQTIMRVLAAAATVYIVLCFLRILLTWFRGISFGKPLELLASVTDPYLDLFQRFRFLKAGQFDFSPIAALAVLAMANTVFLALAYYGRVTFGIVFSTLVDALWSAAAFILSFYLILASIRLIGYLSGKNLLPAVFKAIDLMLGPALYRISRIIYRDKIVNFWQGLITAIFVLAALRFGLGYLVDLISRTLARLPF